MHLVFITTGGTIDKDYPHTTKGYAFEFGEETATHRLIKTIIPNPSFTYEIISICQKDSLEIDDVDRNNIWDCILVKLQQHADKNDSDNDIAFIITHGTDTLIETGQYLSMKIKEKQQQTTDTNSKTANTKTSSQPIIIVLTGAMRPERFTNSDASINWGVAIGATQMLVLMKHQQKQKEDGDHDDDDDDDSVYIAMNGIVKSSKDIQRNMDTGKFF